MGERTFIAYWSGDLSSQEQSALVRPGWKLYKNAIGRGTSWYGEGGPPPGAPSTEPRQMLRLRANDEAEARELLIDALGREPETLTVSEGETAD